MSERIERSDWVSRINAVKHEGFEMLTCVDRGSHLQLWFRTCTGTTLFTDLSDAPAPSVTSVFDAALWKEREIHDMFGVTFDNASSNESLFFVDSELQGSAPLRKNVLLKQRHEITWPGTKDPADSATSPSRRKSLPLGVEAETSDRELL
ncbi:MAG: hypothetical protein RL410_1100 [Actinomycetota bacterium]|jgi:hypothetical protein